MCLWQPDRCNVEVLRTTHFRSAAQPSIEGVGPAVVFAGQRSRAFAVAGCQWACAMAAHVVERAQHAVVATHDDERDTGNLSDDMVAVPRNLLGTPDQLPAARKHCVAFEDMKRRIDITMCRQGDRGLRRLRLQPRGIGRRGELGLHRLVANRCTARARAFTASAARSRGGAVVCNERSRRPETSAISSIAARNAASFAFDGLLKPLNLRTNCNDAARISSSVTGGSKLKSVRIFLHTGVLQRESLPVILLTFRSR